MEQTTVFMKTRGQIYLSKLPAMPVLMSYAMCFEFSWNIIKTKIQKPAK
jgi:hypothetical protein